MVNLLTGLLSCFRHRPLVNVPDGLRRFSMSELEQATGNFSHVVAGLSQGDFYWGKTYKGEIQTENGAVELMAVKCNEKRLLKTGPHNELHNELRWLSRLHHRNIVQLLGYAREGEVLVFVYEFVSQGLLFDMLNRERDAADDGRGQLLLSWERRLRIAFGVAQGLFYLHNEVSLPIIHRDIQPRSILVDDSFEPKITNFAFAKVEEEGQERWIAGALGYIDPEYARTLQLTKAADVYGLGVVMLELATGWPVVGYQNGQRRGHIIQMVAKELVSSGFEAIVAKSLKLQGGLGNNFPGTFRCFVKLAMQCCSRNRNVRPSSRAVAEKLHEMLTGEGEDSMEDAAFMAELGSYNVTASLSHADLNSDDEASEVERSSVGTI